MGLMHSVTQNPWRSPRLWRFLYLSSIVAFVIILALGIYSATTIWYLNTFGLHAIGTVVAQDSPGWSVRYRSPDEGVTTTHVDWLPQGTGLGDTVDLRYSPVAWLVPQVSDTPVVCVLPILAFSLVPLMAAILYKRRYLRLKTGPGVPLNCH
jgi:hypothetical protein